MVGRFNGGINLGADGLNPLGLSAIALVKQPQGNFQNFLC